MATPPFLVVEDRLYERTTEMTPEEIRGVVLANNGSVQAAATQLNLPPDVVQAAVNAGDGTPTIGAGDVKGGTLEHVKDIIGLMAGVGVVVYVLGGGVLIARLYFANLPAQAVFGQLPREFLITVGISQVFVFGLIVAAVYSLARGSGFFTGTQASNAKVIVSILFGCPVLIALVLFISGETKGGVPALKDAIGFWAIVAGLLLITVVAAGVVRRQYAKGNVRWRPGPEWMTLAIAYGFVGMVTAACVAATFPLLDAKACASSGFEERGALVGHSGDRIFLGEPTADRRRIVSLPSADVEELFVGPDAGLAGCDPRGPAAAIFAAKQARIAEDARGNARAQRRLINGAKNVQLAANGAGKLAEAAFIAGRSARRAADGADKADAGSGNELSVEAGALADAGREADFAAAQLQIAVDRIRGADEGEPPNLTALRKASAETVAKAEAATEQADTLAQQAVDLVTRPPG